MADILDGDPLGKFFDPPKKDEGGPLDGFFDTDEGGPSGNYEGDTPERILSDIDKYADEFDAGRSSKADKRESGKDFASTVARSSFDLSMVPEPVSDEPPSWYAGGPDGRIKLAQKKKVASPADLFEEASGRIATGKGVAPWFKYISNNYDFESGSVEDLKQSTDHLLDFDRPREYNSYESQRAVALASGSVSEDLRANENDFRVVTKGQPRKAWVNAKVDAMADKYNLSDREKFDVYNDVVNQYGYRAQEKQAKDYADWKMLQKYNRMPSDLLADDANRIYADKIETERIVTSAPYKAQVEAEDQEADQLTSTVVSEYDTIMSAAAEQLKAEVEAGRVTPAIANRRLELLDQTTKADAEAKLEQIQTSYVRKLRAIEDEANAVFKERSEEYIKQASELAGLTPEQMKDYAKFYNQGYRGAMLRIGKIKEAVFRANPFISHPMARVSMSQVGQHLLAGTAVDIVSMIGGALGKAGFEAAELNLRQFSEDARRQLDIPELTEGSGLDYEFWGGHIARALPFSALTAGPAVGVGFGARMLGRLAGMSRIPAQLAGGLAGGTTSFMFETKLEGADVWIRALEEGHSKEEAFRMAAQTERYNLANLALNVFEFMSVFKIGKGFTRFIESPITTGLLEGVQEVWQGFAQEKPFNKDLTFWDYLKSDRVRVEFVTGAALGGMMGTFGYFNNDKGTNTSAISSLFENALSEGSAAFAKEWAPRAAVEVAAQNGFITPENAAEAEAELDILAQAYKSVAGIDDQNKRSAALVLTADVIRLRGKAAGLEEGDPVRASLESAIKAKERGIADIMNDKAVIYAVYQEGDRAPYIATKEDMDRYLDPANTEFAKGLADGSIRIDVINDPSLETKMGEALEAGRKLLEAERAELDKLRAATIRGAETDAGVGFEFVSPNVEEDMSFEQAQAAVHSPEQLAAIEMQRELHQALGLEATTESAIGDWADGAENTTSTEIKASSDFETIKYAAAVSGLAENQKAVIAFRQKEGGKDGVFKIEGVRQGLKEVRKALDAAGIKFRTFTGKAGATSILIFDQGLADAGKIAKFAQDNGYEAKLFIGEGEFIGGETREEGAAEYRRIIQSYESGRPDVASLSKSYGQQQYGERVHSARQEGATPESRTFTAGERGGILEHAKRVTERIGEVAGKIVSDAANVLAAIKPLVKSAKVVVHDSTDSFKSRLGKHWEAGQAAVVISKDGHIVIHIDAEQAEAFGETNVMFHEGAHPILNALLKTNPKLLDRLYTQLKSLPGSERHIDFGLQYGEEGDPQTKKEALVEFFADVANGDYSINDSNISAIRKLLSGFLETIGFTDMAKKVRAAGRAELIGIAEDIASAFRAGREVSIGEAGAEAELESTIVEAKKRIATNVDAVRDLLSGATGAVIPLDLKGEVQRAERAIVKEVAAQAASYAKKIKKETGRTGLALMTYDDLESFASHIGQPVSIAVIEGYNEGITGIRLSNRNEVLLPMGTVEEALNKVFDKGMPTGAEIMRASQVRPETIAGLPKFNDYGQMVDDMQRAIEGYGDTMDWYKEIAELFKGIVGEANMVEFGMLFGLTSSRAPVIANIESTLWLMGNARINPPTTPHGEAAFMGQSFETEFLPSGTRLYLAKDASGISAQSLRRTILDIYNGRGFLSPSSVKTYVYGPLTMDRAYGSFNPFSVNDTHQIRFFTGGGFDQSMLSNSYWQRVMMYLNGRLGMDFDLRPDQIQATGWAFARANYGAKSKLPGTVKELLDSDRFIKMRDWIGEMVSDGTFNVGLPFSPQVAASNMGFVSDKAVNGYYSTFLYTKELEKVKKGIYEDNTAAIDVGAKLEFSKRRGNEVLKAKAALIRQAPAFGAAEIKSDQNEGYKRLDSVSRTPTKEPVTDTAGADQGKWADPGSYKDVDSAESAAEFAKARGFVTPKGRGNATHLINAVNKAYGTDYELIQDIDDKNPAGNGVKANVPAVEKIAGVSRETETVEASKRTPIEERVKWASELLGAEITQEHLAEARAKAPKKETPEEKVIRKAGVKEITDNMATPAELDENHAAYFTLPDEPLTPNIKDITRRKSMGELIKSSNTAAKLMKAASQGRYGKRAPIAVRPEGKKSKWVVADGNSTHAAAERYGWETLPVAFERMDPTVGRLILDLMPMMPVFEEARKEIIGVTKDALKGIDGFSTDNRVKKALRASQKAYNDYFETGEGLDGLKDMARNDAVVMREEDIPVVMERIREAYGGKKNLIKDQPIDTDAGFSSNYIVPVTKNGTKAEFQILTLPMFVGKEGLEFVKSSHMKQAKAALAKARRLTGSKIPDGMGHWFYEIIRDERTTDAGESVANAMSKIYYSSFLGTQSYLDALERNSSLVSRSESLSEVSRRALFEFLLNDFINGLMITDREVLGEYLTSSPGSVKTYLSSLEFIIENKYTKEHLEKKAPAKKKAEQYVADYLIAEESGEMQPTSETVEAKKGGGRAVSPDDVFYHGTSTDEAALSREGGFFFTKDKGLADAYGEKGKTISAHLDIKNPKIIDFKGERSYEFDEEIEQAKQEGYDSVILQNVIDHKDGVPETQYVVFDKSQIKPAKPEAVTDRAGKYREGDVIDGSELQSASGDNVIGEKGEKYRLVKRPLSDFDYTRQHIYDDWGTDAESKALEDARIDKMKREFNDLPPIPPGPDDGLHRIVAAKELGEKTILQWKKITAKPEAKGKPAPPAAEGGVGVFEPEQYVDDYMAIDFNEEGNAIRDINKQIGGVKNIQYPLTVYRGINTKSTPERGYDGGHWSTDRKVAESFGDKVEEKIINNPNEIDLEQTIRSRVMNPAEKEIYVEVKEQPLPTQEVKAGKEVGSGVGGDVEFTAKGGNKIVDENGQPKTVYYGTARGGEPTLINFEDELGGHFGSTKEQAQEAINRDNESTGSNKKGVVKEYFISIKNPLRVPDIGRWYPNRIFDEIIEPSNMKYPKTETVKGLGEMDITNRTAEDIIKILKDNGYDGLVYENEHEGKGDSYIALDKSQIKAVEQSLPTPEVKVKPAPAEVSGEVEDKTQKSKQDAIQESSTAGVSPRQQAQGGKPQRVGQKEQGKEATQEGEEEIVEASKRSPDKKSYTAVGRKGRDEMDRAMLDYAVKILRSAKGDYGEARKAVKAAFERLDIKVRVLADLMADAVVEYDAAKKAARVLDPTVKRAIAASTGIKKDPLPITMDERKSLKTLLRRAAMSAAHDQKVIASEVSTFLNNNPLVSKMPPRQVKSLIRRASKLTLKGLDAFLEYADKAIGDANYMGKVAEAKSLARSLKSKLSWKGMFANNKDVMRALSRINPSEVEDIDEYLNMAHGALNSLRSPANKKYQPFDMRGTEEYVKRILAEFEAEFIESVQDRAGILGLTAEEAKIINDFLEAEDADRFVNNLREAQVKALRDNLARIASYSQMAAESLEGDTIRAQGWVKAVRDADLSILNEKVLAEYIRSVDNAVMNASIDNIGRVAALIRAAEIAKWAAGYSREHGTLKLKDIELLYNSFPQLLEVVFGTAGRVADVRTETGIEDIFRNGSKVNSLIEDIYNEYVKFKKSAGVKDDAKHNLIRGMYAYAIQHSGGTEQEINDRVRNNLEKIAESINRLALSDKTKAVAEAAVEVFEQFSGLKTLNEIKALMGARYAVDKSAVEFWQRKYSQVKEALKENTEGIHNEMFDDEVEYTPISMILSDDTNRTAEDEVVSFQRDGFPAAPKRAPTTIKRTHAQRLPAGWAISFDFDSNMLGKMQKSLYDIHTSEARMAFREFLKTREAAMLYGGVDNKERVSKVYTDSEKIQRGVGFENDVAGKTIAAGTTALRNLMVVQALGGVFQFIKQYPPVMLAAMLRLGPNAGLLFSAFRFAKDNPIYKLSQIGERGKIEAGAERGENILHRRIVSRIGEGMIRKASEKLKSYTRGARHIALASLRAGDVSAAKRTWMAYYLESLKNQGIDPSSVNPETEYLRSGEPERKLAMAYAEQRVATTQVGNNPVENPALYKPGSGYARVFRDIFLPYSMFANAMRARLINDVRQIVGGDTEAKRIAAKDMAITAVEAAAFHSIGIYLIGGVLAPAGIKLLFQLFDIDDKELTEEEKKAEIDRKASRWYARMLADYFVGGLGSIVENSFLSMANWTYYRMLKAVDSPKIKYPNGREMSYESFRDLSLAPFYQYSKIEGQHWGLYQGAGDRVSDIVTDVKNLSTGSHEVYHPMHGVLRMEMSEEEKDFTVFTTIMHSLYIFGANDADLTRTVSRAQRAMAKKYDSHAAVRRGYRMKQDAMENVVVPYRRPQ